MIGLQRISIAVRLGLLTSALCAWAITVTSANAAIVNTLCSFNGYINGDRPEGSLTQANDGNLYGVAYYGGTYNGGVVFRIAANGEPVTIHSFNGLTEGAHPDCHLLLAADGYLYGSTVEGGTGNFGTIFKIGTDGTPTTLYNCTGGEGGIHPTGSMVQGADGTIYGSTQDTIYKMSTAGVVTPLWYSSTLQAHTSVVCDSSGNLYGATAGDGVGYGTIFSIAPNGTYSVLYTFMDTGDGGNPAGDLIWGSDGNLYGTTGVTSYSVGTFFEVTTSGDLTTLYAFPDGQVTTNSALLQANDGSFYGINRDYYGGIYNLTTSGDYSSLYSWQTYTQGDLPYGPLVQAPDGQLYGAESGGGPDSVPGYSTGSGGLYSLTTEGTFNQLSNFVDCNNGQQPTNLILGADGNYYGTTLNGGRYGTGSIFKATPAGTLTSIYAFPSAYEMTATHATLTSGIDGKLYGTAYSSYYGTSPSAGYIFELGFNGTMTVLYTFTGGSDGGTPQGALVQGPDGNFYGTTTGGGSAGFGTFFKITPSGNLTTLCSFPFSYSAATGCQAELLVGADGNFYGTTYAAGSYGFGTVFQLTPTGGLTLVHTFTGNADDGYCLGGLVQLADGNLYGTTSGVGSHYGTVFKVSPSGTFQTIHTFNNSTDGGNPHAGLLSIGDGNLYGVTEGGGPGLGGTVYSITPSGQFTVLNSIVAPAGVGQHTPLIQGADGNLYGSTYYGGAGAVAGSLYRLELSAPNAPQNPSAVAGDETVTVGWQPAVGALSYNIYRSSTPGGEGSTPYQENVQSLSSSDTGLVNGDTYYYQVTAVNDLGESPKSAEVSATPRVPTTTTVSPSPNPSIYGQTVTITSTVTGQSPTGTVQFVIDGTNAGSPVTLTNGAASYSTSTLAAGQHSISATYSGDSINAVSTSATATDTVDQASTTTTVSPSPNPSIYGQTVTITATVIGVSPTGTVQFVIDGSNAGSPVTLTNGTASYSTSTLAAGQHSISATYSGDSNNAVSTSTSVTQTVDQASTTTTVSPSPNPSIYGQTVTITAMVTGVSPTGTVQFLIDGSNAGSPVTLTNGTASHSTSTLAAGQHSISATYSGDSNNAASTSTSVTLTVTPATSSISVSSSPNPSIFGQAVTLTATVMGVSPTGTVQFKIDGANAGSGVTVTNGRSTYTTSTLAVGRHSITAIYTGDANNTGSTSTLMMETVNTSSTASFVKSDAATQGNWKGVYGADGWNVIGDTSGNATSYPSYATVTPGSHLSGVWAASSLLPGALQSAAAGSANRMAGVWYQTSWSMDVDVTGTHQLALYLLDINNDGFAETITIKDAVTGNILDTRSASSFAGGVYYVWNVSGNVTISLTSTAGHWAVLSGLFFGGTGPTAPSTPSSVTAATGSQQIALTWGASTGATSYNVYRGTASGAESTTPIATGLTGTSCTDTGLAAGSTYYYKVVAVNAVGGSFASVEASATVPKSTVSFLKADASTEGNWKGVYGADGWNVIGDTSGNATSYPSYATVTPGSHDSGVWAASSLLPSALQSAAAGSANRLAGVWYQTSWSMTVNVTGTHQLALYLLDINNDGFAETITIKDASTGTTLDTRTASNFAGGVYYVWNVSGNVTISLTSTAGHWAVLSGIFFGGTGPTAPSTPSSVTATAGVQQIGLTWGASTGATSYNVYRGTAAGAESTTPIATGVIGTTYTNTGLTAGSTYYYKIVAVNAVGGGFASAEATATVPTSTAAFVKIDTTTEGSWKGVYGADGWNVFGDPSTNNPTIPTYAQITPGSHLSGVWVGTSTAAKCLEASATNSTNRLAGVWYQTSWSMNVDITGTHQLALYLLDINNLGFAESITIKDAATGTVLDTRQASSFANGEYLVWNVSGNVTITLTSTSTAGHWAVLSGIFFGN